MVVGQILEAAAEHLDVRIGGRLDLGLDAHADDGRRHALDDVGEARSLGRLDANGFGENRNGAGGHGAEAGGAYDCDGGHGGEKPLAAAGNWLGGVGHLFQSSSWGCFDGILGDER